MSANVNLCSNAARKRSIIHLAVRLWGKILIVAAVVGLASTIFVWRDSEAARLNRAALESRYKPLQRMRADAETAKTNLLDLQQRERIALNFAAGIKSLSLIEAVSAAAKSTAGNTYIEHFEFRVLDRTLADSSGQFLLRLRGIGKNDDAVAKFVAEMRKVNAFDNVELRSSRAKQKGEALVREFQVDCSHNAIEFSK